MFGSKRQYSAAMDMAAMMFEMERFDEARTEALRALGIAEKGFGPDSEQVHDALSALGEIFKPLGAIDEAEPYARRRVEIATLVWGPGSEPLADALFELGTLLHVKGDAAEAAFVLNRFLTEADASDAFEDYDAVPALVTLAEIAMEDERIDEADELLARALDLVESNRLQDDPQSFEVYLVTARLRQIQERPAEGETLLRALIERQQADPETEASDLSDSLNQLSSVLKQMERFSEAIKVMQESIRLAAESRGEDDLSLCILTRNLADLFEDMSDTENADIAWADAAACAERTLGASDPITIDILSDFGGALYRRMQAERALPVVARVVALLRAESHADPDLLAANLNRLAGIYSDLGNHEDAERTYREALEIARASNGPNDVSVQICLANLGQSLIDLGRFDQAVEALEEALDVLRDEPHPPSGIVGTYERLGFALLELDRTEDAERVYRRGAELAESGGESLSPDYGILLRDLGGLLMITERPQEAESYLRDALDVQETTLGADHIALVDTLSILAAALMETERLEEAEEVLRRAVGIVDSAPEPVDPERLVDVYTQLGEVLTERKAHDEAEPLFREALDTARESFEPEHDAIMWARNRYTALLVMQERYDEAEALLREALEVLDNDEEPRIEPFAATLLGLGKVLQLTGRFDEAEHPMRRGIAMDEKLHGEDMPELAFGYVRLAEILNELGRLDEMAQARDHARDLASGVPVSDPDREELFERIDKLSQVRP